MNNKGKIAYEAYCAALNFVDYNTGQTLPHFEQLSTSLKNAWDKAAKAVGDDIQVQTGRG